MKEDKDTFYCHKAKGELRWWFHFGRDCVNIEISWPRLNIRFSIDPDSDYVLSLGFMGLYISLTCYKLARLLKNHESSFSFYWYEWGLWLQLWGSGYSSSWDDPWYAKMHVLYLDDLILGKKKYTCEKGQVFENVVIPMEDKNYLARMTYQTQTWKRACWFPVIRKSTDIEMIESTPKFPGKGENSWDQGDDGIWGMSSEGHCIPTAIGTYVTAVLKYREKRG